MDNQQQQPVNLPEQTTNDLTTDDGRKIVSFSTAGESYSIETSEQAAKGKIAEIDAEIAEIKLNAIRRGILRVKI